MKFTKRLAAIAACACMATSSMISTAASAAYDDEHITSTIENVIDDSNAILADSTLNLNYAGTYYSTINDGSFTLTKNDDGTYNCRFSNVYLGGTNYCSGNVSCFLRPTATLLVSGTKIGTFTFTTEDYYSETCDMYYYNNRYDHNITIFIHGIPYEKAL